jgi:hypothetical protein
VSTVGVVTRIRAAIPGVRVPPEARNRHQFVRPNRSPIQQVPGLFPKGAERQGR